MLFTSSTDCPKEEDNELLLHCNVVRHERDTASVVVVLTGRNAFASIRQLRHLLHKFESIRPPVRVSYV